MRARLRLGLLGILSGDRLYDAGMFPLRLVGPAWGRERRGPEKRDGVVQRVQALDQETVVGSPIDGAVERKVVLRPRFGIPGEPRLRRDHLLQDRHLARARMTGGERGGGSLERLAHVVELARCLLIERGDDETGPGVTTSRPSTSRRERAWR